MRKIDVQCCIAGGGPAGMMLGYLLARAGVRVAVLEKHADFLRDFRGDTIHPSTLQLMHELGLLDEFLKLPHQEARQLHAQVGQRTFTVADFSHLPTTCRFIAFMPQWDFLDFLARQGRTLPTFELMMRTEAKGLIEAGGRVAGVRAAMPDGEVEVRAALTVAADGRHSTVRPAAGMKVSELGAPMDVLWFHLSRRPADPDQPMGVFAAGRIFIMIARGEQWQCGYVIAKGALNDIEAAGLDAFRREVAALAPFAADRTGEVASFDDLKLLTVQVDRLERWWKPGLLCIGDAAHAMSPVGGVGINLAIQDAVATANLLAAPLRTGSVSDDDLARVQVRRELPTRLTQAVQVAVQRRVIANVLAGTEAPSPPLALRLLDRFPILRRLPARMIGLGFRPEHIDSPAVASG